MSSKIGVSTWSLQQTTYDRGYTIDQLIDAVAEMGVDGFDLFSEYIPCYPSLDLCELHRIVRRCKENGLAITSTWFFCDGVSSVYTSSLDNVVEHTRRDIATTAACDCGYMTVPMIFNTPGFTNEMNYEYLMRFFERVLPIAEEYHVHLAHECAREGAPELALRLHAALQNDYYTICPDLEAWRVSTPDLPVTHAEDDGQKESKPETIDVFKACLPHCGVIHYKLLALDEAGEEPHFPIRELMDAVNESPRQHHLVLEYEGWIPDIHPERDSIVETRRCVEMIRRYQK